MIGQLETGSPKIVGFKMSGTLRDEDYKTLEPMVESAVASEGKVRLLAKLEDFHGWDLRGAWDDLRFATKHYSDFDRIAMVGDRGWQHWMANLSKPFTRAKVRFFDASKTDTLNGLHDAWANVCLGLFA